MIDLTFFIDSASDLVFTFDTVINIEGREVYTGAYQVTPKRYEQVLDTSNKIMTEDVTVYEIPYAEVSNQYGTTYTIAS